MQQVACSPASSMNCISRSLLTALVCVVLLWSPTDAAELDGQAWLDRVLPTVQKIIETPLIGGGEARTDRVAISTDGRWLAYGQLNASVSDNTNIQSLWLYDAVHGGAAQEIFNTTPRSGIYLHFEPQFSPDGSSLAFLGGPPPGDQLTQSDVIIRSLKDGSEQSISASSIPSSMLGKNQHVTGISDLAWSPDGQSLVFEVETEDTDQPLHGVEISLATYATDKVVEPVALILYSIASHQWRRVSPSDLNVDSFSISPDGRELAISASAHNVTPLHYMFTCIYIVDVKSGWVRELPCPSGRNANPRWSPDGHMLAFGSQGGDLRYLGGTRVAVYDIGTHKLTLPGFDEIGRISGSGASYMWAPDSKSMLLTLPYHMTHQLFFLDVRSGELTQFTHDDSNDYLGLGFRKGGRDIVFMDQSFLIPPHIENSPTAYFAPEPLMASASNLELDVELQRLSWKSGKWTVNGWLLLPKVRSKTPLFVYAEGGPNMVTPQFRSGGFQYPIQAFLANGVAVLIPNSRGRPGYGVPFERAWESEQDYGNGPLQDVLSGVDAAVATGQIDGSRVALAGHSWGGYLAAYAETHTDRFKAILIHEGVSLDSLGPETLVGGDPAWIAFTHQNGGTLPFDAAGFDHSKLLSPIYNVSHAKAPALIEAGAQSHLQDEAELFHGLAAFHVPVELIGYPRSSHVTEEPCMLFDAANRELEWFAYWVLGDPTDRMNARYGPVNGRN